jgi:hypothetical protein
MYEIRRPIVLVKNLLGLLGREGGADGCNEDEEWKHDQSLHNNDFLSGK